MPRRSPERIAEVVSELLRNIEEQLTVEDRRIEIRVPPGVVRIATTIRSDYRFVADTGLKRNISYAVEALDFYRWIINRFRLYGPVASYLYKTGIILVNMIIEGLVHDFLRREGIKPANKHSRNIRKLREQCGAPKALCERIDHLREQRSTIHLYLLRESEADAYSLRDWNKAVTLLRHVREYFSRRVEPS